MFPQNEVCRIMLKKTSLENLDARVILSFKYPAWVLKINAPFKISGVFPQIISKIKIKNTSLDNEANITQTIITHLT